tara:strand:+ start:395 stop:520 length:126 start_codon:yes stop_codon:yes gene_type:complete
MVLQEVMRAVAVAVQLLVVWKQFNLVQVKEVDKVVLEQHQI